MKEILEKMSVWLYPFRCPFCGEIVTDREDRICGSCRKKLNYIIEPSCKKCGRPLHVQEEEYCQVCRQGKTYYTQGKSVFLYEEDVKQSIYRFKYKNKREYATVYAAEILRRYGRWIDAMEPEALIPVPIHRTKRRKRGFNQAEIVAEKLGAALHIPVVSNLVERTKKTRPQKELNHAERKNNLKRAFLIRENRVKLKRILIVDDIFTTGSTINEIACVLAEAGVDQIYFICISTGRELS